MRLDLLLELRLCLIKLFLFLFFPVLLFDLPKPGTRLGVSLLDDSLKHNIHRELSKTRVNEDGHSAHDALSFPLQSRLQTMPAKGMTTRGSHWMTHKVPAY